MNWLTPNLLLLLGYELISDDGVYGRYQNVAGLNVPGHGIMPRGKRLISFNRQYTEGRGENAISYVYLGIKEDGGTRTVFNGVLKNEEELRTILSFVR